MAKKKLILTDAFEVDFTLLGLICQHKDYRLCYSINDKLGVDLQKQDDLELFINKPAERAAFSLYESPMDDERLLQVAQNKNPRGYLLPEQPQLDFLLILRGSYRQDEVMSIKTKLKESPLILGVYDINVAKMKSKNNLMF